MNLCVNKVFHAMFIVTMFTWVIRFPIISLWSKMHYGVSLLYVGYRNERFACWKGDPQECLQTGWSPCKIPLNPSKDRDGIERIKSKI